MITFINFFLCQCHNSIFHFKTILFLKCLQQNDCVYGNSIRFPIELPVHAHFLTDRLPIRKKRKADYNRTRKNDECACFLRMDSIIEFLICSIIWIEKKDKYREILIDFRKSASNLQPGVNHVYVYSRLFIAFVVLSTISLSGSLHCHQNINVDIDKVTLTRRNSLKLVQ